jgi:hypothetical protein
MRRIDLIAIHCAATPEGRNVTAADVDRMHRQRGFRKIGYHFFLRLDGTREMGRSLEEVGAHVEGHNANSIGICYAGGVDARGKAKDTRTPEQRAAMRTLIVELKARFPHARICGHRDLSPDRDRDGRVEPHEWLKDCPSFDVGAWLQEEGL